MKRLAAALRAAAAMKSCQVADSEPVTTPEPAVDWRVEAYTYGVVAPGTYTVVCVPAGDLALPSSARTTRKEVITDAATATNSQQPDPCPEGTPTGRFGGAG